MEPRLLPKLEPKFKQFILVSGLVDTQQRSLQLQAVKSILEIYPNDSQIHGQAMKVLVQDFVESPDANLRLLGLMTLNARMKADDGSIFA